MAYGLPAMRTAEENSSERVAILDLNESIIVYLIQDFWSQASSTALSEF
jgi:hypothetical protein